MQSVKKLIEEEIVEKTKQKCEAKNRKRRSRTCSKISEDMNVLIAGDDDHAEKSDDQCPRISQNEVDLVNGDSEEKFSELIKRLIAQKDSEVESCKNLVDAFQVLDSKQESFLNIGTPISGDSQRIKETQCTQTIVILKPETNSLHVGSSPGTPSTDNKAKGKFSSRFLLSRIRRRLKFSAGKNPCNAQHDSDPDLDPYTLSSNMSQNCCLGEETETNSERNVSDGEMLSENASKSEAKKEGTIHGSEDSKKSMCGIYITAKKHLSEMLAEGDTDTESPDKEAPRILGKILAIPEFSTPENSPRVTLALDHQIIDKPNIHQCSSEDYYEPLGQLDSNKHEETEFTRDMPVPEGD